MISDKVTIYPTAKKQGEEKDSYSEFAVKKFTTIISFIANQMEHVCSKKPQACLFYFPYLSEETTSMSSYARY